MNVNDENAVPSARKTRTRGGLRSRPVLAAKPVEADVAAKNEEPAAPATTKPAGGSSAILRSWEKPHDFFILDLAEPMLRCDASW